MKRLRELSAGLVIAAVPGGCGAATANTTPTPTPAAAARTTHSATTAAAGVTVRGVQITHTLSTHALRFSGTPITATMTLRTASRRRTIAIGLQPSTWPEHRILGLPLKISKATITGAGHLSGYYESSGPLPGLPGMSVCRRGAAVPAGSGIDLKLPADSTTKLTWRVGFAAPPWRGQSIRVGWVIHVPSSSYTPKRIAERMIRSGPLIPRGPTGVHIRLRAGAGASPPTHGSALRYPRVRAGHLVRVLGTTAPRVQNAKITVGAISTIGHHRLRIATVRTDSAGHFRASWLPRNAGNYTINAALRHPPSGLLPDRTCDLALTITR